MANVRTIISGETLGTLKPIDFGAEPGMGAIILTWLMEKVAQPVPDVDGDGNPVTRAPTFEEAFAQILEPTYANWAREALEYHEEKLRAAAELPAMPSAELSVSIDSTP